jgi:hypothetical protein
MKSVPLYYVWQYTDVDRAFWEEHLEAWVPRRVFDVHAHVNDPQCRVVAMTEERRRQHWTHELAEPIGAADAQRCHELVYPGREFCCLAFGYPLPDYDIAQSNAGLQAACLRRGWYRLAVIRPQWSADQIARELDQPNVLGGKVYHALLGQDLDNPDEHREADLFEIVPRHQLEVLNERRAWLTVHLPKAQGLAHSENIARIRQLRQQYPGVMLVLAHLGRCYTLPQAQAGLPPLADDEGIYFDTSAVLNPEVLKFALKRLGPQRLLFGSESPASYARGRARWEGDHCFRHTSYPFQFNRDCPSPQVEAGDTLCLYEALRALRQACELQMLDRYQVEGIFHDNAQRLIEVVQSRRGSRHGSP